MNINPGQEPIKYDTYPNFKLHKSFNGKVEFLPTGLSELSSRHFTIRATNGKCLQFDVPLMERACNVLLSIGVVPYSFFFDELEDDKMKEATEKLEKEEIVCFTSGNITSLIYNSEQIQLPNARGRHH